MKKIDGKTRKRT